MCGRLTAKRLGTQDFCRTDGCNLALQRKSGKVVVLRFFSMLCVWVCYKYCTAPFSGSCLRATDSQLSQSFLGWSKNIIKYLKLRLKLICCQTAWSHQSVFLYYLHVYIYIYIYLSLYIYISFIIYIYQYNDWSSLLCMCAWIDMLNISMVDRVGTWLTSHAKKKKKKKKKKKGWYMKRWTRWRGVKALFCLQPFLCPESST